MKAASFGCSPPQIPEEKGLVPASAYYPWPPKPFSVFGRPPVPRKAVQSCYVNPPGFVPLIPLNPFYTLLSVGPNWCLDSARGTVVVFFEGEEVQSNLKREPEHCIFSSVESAQSTKMFVTSRAKLHLSQGRGLISLVTNAQTVS